MGGGREGNGKGVDVQNWAKQERQKKKEMGRERRKGGWVNWNTPWKGM